MQKSPTQKRQVRVQMCTCQELMTSVTVKSAAGKTRDDASGVV